MLTHKEAQELHELIGAALEGCGTRAGLLRARELAALVVSDTTPTRRPPSYRTDARGVVLVLDVARYTATHPDADICRCGSCGRSWDDAVPTAWTPAPGARCPFEYRANHR